MPIKTSNYTYDLVEQYFLKNLSENDFWLFGSHSFETALTNSNDSNISSRQFLEKAVFGTKITSTDISFMIPVRDWEAETIYTQYDDIVELKNKPYYITVEPEIESGNYHIFKCLSNNFGAKSTQKPQFSPSIEDGIYILSDGYIWKLMTTIPFTLYQKFATLGLIPVPRSIEVENSTIQGIFNITVENPLENFGYERITGIVNASEEISGGTVTRVFLKNLFSLTLNQIPIFDVPNTYSSRSVYIQKSNSGIGIGAIEATIISSGIIAGIPFVTFQTPSSFQITAEDSVEILPKIEIQGNGNDASAVAIFDFVNTRIAGIKMLNFGSGYSAASARVVDPGVFDPENTNRQDVRCVTRVIISPTGGHGSNVLSELSSNQLAISKTINSNFPSNIPDVGSYSKIGLVKNPDFTAGYTDFTFDNRLEVVMSFIPGNMQVGDIVTQGIIKGIIHEIDVATDTIYIAEYSGPYDGNFAVALPITHRGINYVINSINYSPYEGRTGSVLTISDLTPIERTADRSEQFKIILDF